MRVLDQELVETPVSPDLYGSFYELGFGRSDLLWGELFFNRDFELERPLAEKNPWLVYSRPHKEEEDWWHSGYEEMKWYLYDQKEKNYDIPVVFNNYWPAAHGRYYVHIDNGTKNHPIWFTQDRIYLKQGRRYIFSGLFSNGSFFSSDKHGKEVALKVCLFKDGEDSVNSHKKNLYVNTNQFSKIELALDTIIDEGWYSFAIEVPKGAKVAFDCLSLHSDDDVYGWRKEAVDMIKEKLAPKTIRFPGGCFASLYDWRDGVGPREERPVNYNSFWNCEFVNDVGSVEFVELCEYLGAEPFFCVPVMFNNAFNAAEWVDFCNNPQNERRLTCGRKEPLNVKYWELENEPYRRFDAITFAQRCVEFCKQMKRADPTIKIAIGNYWVYNSKFKEMLEIVGPYVDLITNRGGSIDEMKNDLLILDEYNKKHGTSIRLCHTEFRAPLTREKVEIDGLNQVQNDTNETLFNRSVRWEYAMNMMEQYIKFQNMGSAFSTANFTNLTDGWGESLINLSKEKVFLSAAGVAYSLLNKLDIVYPLQVEAEQDKDLVYQVAWNEQKDKLTILLLNFSSESKEVLIDLRDIQKDFDKEGMMYKIDQNVLKDFNSPSQYDLVREKSKKVKVTKKQKQILNPYACVAVELFIK